MKEKTKNINSVKEDTAILNKENKNKDEIISTEKNDIKDNVQEDIREEIEKTKKVKKTKKVREREGRHSRCRKWLEESQEHFFTQSINKCIYFAF